MPPCLIGMEACFGAHHLSRKLQAFGHDARLMLAKYMRPYSKDSHPSPARGQHPTTSKSGCCASRQIRVADVSEWDGPAVLPPRTAQPSTRMRCRIRQDLALRQYQIPTSMA
jgi:hypothetical protein